MIVKMPTSGHLVFTAEPMDAVVAELRRRAWHGSWDGTESRRNWRYVRHCTVDHLPTDSRVMFTRDYGHHTGGWFKNPDYERCYHLSTSYRDRHTGETIPQDRARTAEWARMFFRNALAYAWMEGPHTPEGKEREVFHVRLFCDAAWQPIKPRGEVYSTEFTGRGWKSASELGRIILSPLTP